VDSSWIDGLERSLVTIELRVAAASLLIILLAIVVSVVARLLALPIPNLAELAVVAMSPLTFLGAAACTYLGKHINIELVQMLRPGKLRGILELAALAGQAAFGLVFTYAAWGFLAYAWESGESLIDLGTPLYVPGAFIVVGALLILLHASLGCCRIVMAKQKVAA
jgi:TRAP-type C4-dicarboxylate transport system permease small subunit